MQKKNRLNGQRERHRRSHVILGKREKRRLTQLGICFALFLIVFFGKGRMPGIVLHCIQTDTDFKGAFTALGDALSRGVPVSLALEDLMVEVFGVQEQAITDRQEMAKQTIGELDVPRIEFPSQLPTRNSMLAMLGVVPKEDGEIQADLIKENEHFSLESIGAPQKIVGTMIPEGAVMEYRDLGIEKIVTPIMGEITSEFGYRNHPVSSEHLFHSGVDIAADAGTSILAFASGNVDFIGQSEAYGLYLQLDHGNGIKTFYCHCEDLYVQKGEKIKAGQIVAAVGETGNATGPHLHLELKQDEVLLNPLHYIDTVE